MSCILSVGTSVPSRIANQEAVLKAAQSWLADTPDAYALFSRFVQSSLNETRHFSIEFEEILKLKSLMKRASLFEELGIGFGESALREALNLAGVPPEAIAFHLFTSCTCPTIPAIDGVIMERAGLRRDTRRLPVYQQGCAGGVVGLGMAATLAESVGKVALTSVELCSLVFYPSDPSPSQLVGSAIFGDGAASVIIDTSDKGLVFLDNESYLLPNSRHLMGYDTFDDGFRLRLDRLLPQELANAVPERVESFLGRNRCAIRDVKYWLFHPGGARILNSLESSLCKPEQAIWAREVLRDVGNLSSASVLFVLKRFLDSKVVKAGDKVVMLGVGPGLTVEQILFEYN